MELNDSDLQKILDTIRNLQSENLEKHCRFEGISPEELKEVVKFIRSVNEAMNDTKKIIRRSVILFILSCLGIVCGLGIISKTKSLLGIDP